MALLSHRTVQQWVPPTSNQLLKSDSEEKQTESERCEADPGLLPEALQLT